VRLNDTVSLLELKCTISVLHAGQYLEAVGSADKMPPEHLLALAMESFAMVGGADVLCLGVHACARRCA